MADCAVGLLCAAGTCSLPASCAQLAAERPGTPDGSYSIQPDRTLTLPPFEAQCDMTDDDGGWMLVTAELLGAEYGRAVTVELAADPMGGIVRTVYTNAIGCGEEPSSYDWVEVVPSMPWQQLRYRQTFHGRSDCLSVFGGTTRVYTGDPNLIPFDPAVDLVRDEVRMGVGVDSFDGTIEACGGTHFWNADTTGLPRAATVIIRKESLLAPAGPATGVSCNTAGPGTDSPTYWQLSQVYVR